MDNAPEQNTSDWLRLRKNYIGASDAAICMGIYHFKLNDKRIKTPHLLWQEKLGLLTGDVDNMATRWGKKNEEPARVEYQHITGHLMFPKVVFHKTIPYMMANLDGMNIDESLAVEIKNPGAEDHFYALRGEVPPHYIPQLQHQMACTGHNKCHYWSFHKGSGILVEVERDNSYIEILLQKESEFWNYVTEFKEPPLVDEDYRQRGDDWNVKADELGQLQVQIRELQKQEQLLKEELEALSEGINSGGSKYRYVKTTVQGNVDWKKIPQLQGVDLEPWRKPNYDKWTLKLL